MIFIVPFSTQIMIFYFSMYTQGYIILQKAAAPNDAPAFPTTFPYLHFPYFSTPSVSMMNLVLPFIPSLIPAKDL